MEAAPHPWPALGALLVRDGLVERDVLDAILAEHRESRRQRISGRRLGEVLVERGIVTAEQVARAVAEQYELPFVELDEAGLDLELSRLLHEDLARHYEALPVERLPSGALLVAVADPATVLFAEDLRRALGTPLQFAVAPPAAVRAAIDAVHAESEASSEPPSEENRVTALVLVADGTPEGEANERARKPSAEEHARPPLGALLVRDGLVTQEHLEAALAQQRVSSDKRLGEILVERGVVEPAEVARVVAEQHELSYVDLAPMDVDLDAARRLPQELARRHGAVAVAFTIDGGLRLAASDPQNVLRSDELHVALGVPLSFVVADPAAIEAAFAFVYRDVAASPGAEPVSVDDPEHLVARAFESGAASIHVLPRPEGLLVRARIDGALHELARVPAADGPAFTLALASLRRVDLGDRMIDVSAHAVPTRDGERLVIRPQPPLTAPPTLEELDVPAAVRAALEDAVRGPTGAVLICSDRRSDARALLYATATTVDGAARTVIALDDDATYVLPDADQVDVGTIAVPTFTSAVRMARRLEPDVLLVGWLEDTPTAELVVEAARAGTLVLAGIASSKVGRLDDLGLEHALLVSHRALRRICASCRGAYYATADDLVVLGQDQSESGCRLLPRARGCPACDESGFDGEIAVYEVQGVTPSLAEQAAGICLEGMTTVDEVRRLADATRAARAPSRDDAAGANARA